MTRTWKDERMHMMRTVREAVQRATKDSEQAFDELAVATGINSQLLREFAHEKPIYTLDMLERLSRHFRHRFDCYTAPDMQMRDMLEFLKSYYWQNQHLQTIFDEKYLQHALYIALWQHYGDFPCYECQYDAITATNEIDLAIPWELAIEIKWLTENQDGRARDYHSEKIARMIANLCRLSYIKRDQQCEQRESQCWLVFGGLRNAFFDFYSLNSMRTLKNRTIAARFFPYDPTNPITTIQLKSQIEELAQHHTKVYKKVVASIKRLELPTSIRVKSHGTEQIWNHDYDYCCIGWEIDRVSSETFVVA